MKIIKLIIVGGISLFLVACGGSGWSDSQRAELFNGCMKEPRMTEYMCNCQIDITISEFTYEEYIKYDNMHPREIPEDVQKRVERLMPDMMECYPDGSIDLR